MDRFMKCAIGNTNTTLVKGTDSQLCGSVDKHIQLGLFQLVLLMNLTKQMNLNYFPVYFNYVHSVTK